MPVLDAPSDSLEGSHALSLANLLVSLNSSEKATIPGKASTTTNALWSDDAPASTSSSRKDLSAMEDLSEQHKVEGLSNGATAAIVVGILLVLTACVYAVWLVIQNRRRERRDSFTADPLSRWSLENQFPMHHLGSPSVRSANAGSDTWISASSISSVKMPTATSARCWPQASAAGNGHLTWTAAPRGGPASGCMWRQEPAWPRPTAARGSGGHYRASEGEHF